MSIAQLNARPLGNCGIGVQVTSTQANSAASTEAKALMSLLAEHGVVVLRDQDIRPHDYVRFAKPFGEIEPSTREAFWLPEQNEIHVISNIVENGRPIGNANDGFFWHTDQYYFERPTAYTFLYGIETPPVGAERSL